MKHPIIEFIENSIPASMQAEAAYTLLVLEDQLHSGFDYRASELLTHLKKAQPQ